jgi:hypothetical protein
MTSQVLDVSMTPLPLPSPAVVFCDVEGGAVLLSTANETYYGLNSVGARVWALLPPVHGSLESLCEALAGEYPEVDPTMLQADVSDLVDDLRRNGLVS